MSKIIKILKALRPDNTHNIRVILLCIFAATTFWFFNSLNENYSTTLHYPIEFLYDQKKYIAVEELPEDVQINVSGLGWNLLRNSLGIKVDPLQVPLETPAEVKKIVGSTMPGFISEQLDEFELNYVLTDTFFINIDYRIKKKFFVYIDSSNISLENNFRIINTIRYTPDTIELEGPSKIIRDLPDSIVVNIPQKDIDENFNEDIAINLPNGRLIRRNPPTINVVFAVAEFVNQELEVPLVMENFPDNAYLEQNTTKLRFTVRQNNVSEISTDNIIVSADFNAWNKSDSTLSYQIISYPDYFYDVAIDTTRAKVKFNE